MPAAAWNDPPGRESEGVSKQSYVNLKNKMNAHAILPMIKHPETRGPAADAVWDVSLERASVMPSTTAARACVGANVKARAAPALMAAGISRAGAVCVLLVRIAVAGRLRL